MDDLSRSFFEMKFELAFLKKKADEFQDFFSDIMERRHNNGDFIRVRPWGNIGDRKNDGYLKSEATLFQVYAPNEMAAAAAIAKIDEDFNGALPHWKQYFDKWKFVHNATKGLGPDITAKLLALDQANANIAVTHFGFVELRGKFFELNETDIVHLVGHVPSSQNLASVGFEAFKTILGQIIITKNSGPIDLRPVPENKLAINNFSDHVKHMIKFGLSKTTLVKEFFEKWPDATYGDSITTSISNEYLRLKGTGINQDNIFYELRNFVLGNGTKTADYEMACLVVLSYFFEECDIFEREAIA
jgi:hypothetical protein